MTIFRRFARILLALALAEGGGLQPVARAQTLPTTRPIELRAGAYLFLDDFLIEQSSNLTRIIHSPKRTLAEPVTNGNDDRNFQPYVTVLRDAQTKRFRMWYDIPVSGGQSHLAYLESPDGIHWIRPHRVLDDPFKIGFGASVVDAGEQVPDPARRYIFVGYQGGLCVAYSKDGLQWTPENSNPVIKGINDITHLAYDPARKRYICVFGFPSRKEDKYLGRTQNSSEGYRRCVGQSVSQDCVHWETPKRIFAPDKQDPGITEFYSVGGVVSRGDLLIGLLKVLRDDLPCDAGGKVDGLGYTVLAWSHDGETWQRDREPFFDRNHEGGTWDHAMAWMDYQLPVGDEMFIYYGGYARGHKVERATERQIGLVRMKRDRYVARAAGEKTGTLRTPLVTMENDCRLALNVDASRGEVRAQLLDAGNKPLRGFRFADCRPVASDTVDGKVTWKRSLAEIRGQPVHLEFSLRNASLFGFQIQR